MTTTILLVDDDIDEHNLFQDAVDGMAICTAVMNGEEALLFLKLHINNLPGFIFLDLNMPLMNGLDCLRALKDDSILKKIPVIVYTNSDNTKEKEEVLALGAAGFLTKPTSIKALRKQIESVLTTNS